MPAFRFLHVSDLHIAARSRVVGLSDLKRPGYPWPGFGSPETDGIGLGLCSTHDPYVLEGVARHVHQNADTFDAVVLTGDVATTGAAADLEAARRFVESEASDLWLAEGDTPTLAASTRQVSLIPGNHDRYDGPRMLPRSDQFDRAFAAYWSAGSSAQTIGVFEKDAAYSAIVGLDLSLRNRHDAEVRWGVWGQGRSYSDVLDRAIEITEALR
ncbi:MAG: metallophosphoesterase, partial [Vicinamibacteria bacterium]|nr:metallophosphoesterase [Vicinamibacteria bacterium]